MATNNTHTREELAALVARSLPGARLRNFHMTEEDGGTLEQVFVVVWKRPDEHRGAEWGTHRAVINYELGESMLVWGHYHRGGQAMVEAYRDYAQRIGVGV